MLVALVCFPRIYLLFPIENVGQLALWKISWASVLGVLPHSYESKPKPPWTGGAYVVNDHVVMASSTDANPKLLKYLYASLYIFDGKAQLHLNKPLPKTS